MLDLKRVLGLAFIAAGGVICLSACGGERATAPALDEPATQRPAVLTTPLSECDYAAAVRAIVRELDSEILAARRMLDDVTSLGEFQARLGQLLPAMLPIFSRALDQVAALPPPAAWAGDHARFVAEQRQLLALRVRLFGALATGQEGLAAGAASETERRTAALRRALSPTFRAIVEAFFDPRRYGGAPG